MKPRFLAGDLWAELKRHGESSPKTLAVAYLSDAVLPLGKADIVITNASRAAIESGQTSAAVLLQAFERGAIVCSLPNLHAKILVTRDAAIVSSANVSRSSRQLSEAGVLLSQRDQVEAVRIHVAQLRAVAHRLSERELRQLVLLPVSRRVAKVRARQPLSSLLEALKNGSPALDQVAFTWYESASKLTMKEVRRAATRAGVYLPSRGDWVWFESPASRGALAAIQKHAQGRPLVAWEIRSDENDEIQRFMAQDATASPLIDAFVTKGRVISIVGTKPFRTPFDLSLDRGLLAQIMTAGIRVAPKTLRRAVNNDRGILTKNQVFELFALGRKALAR